MEAKGTDRGSDAKLSRLHYVAESKSADGAPPSLTPNVIRFTEFCTSEEFGEDLVAFERKYCSHFRGADLDGEQQLDWTDLHKEYLSMVETKLDNFCERSGGCTPEELFIEIQTIAADKDLGEFLPQVILNTEYWHFAAQMKFAAENDEHREEAAVVAQEPEGQGDHRAGMNLSGVYRASPDHPLDTDNWSMFLEGINVPWVFRKVAVRAMQQIQDVYVTQTDDKMIFKVRVVDVTKVLLFLQRHLF